jgi:hypothetical protein
MERFGIDFASLLNTQLDAAHPGGGASTSAPMIAIPCRTDQR